MKPYALITGGSRGIGAAVAKKLASDGFPVLINYAKNTSAAEAVKADIEKAFDMKEAGTKDGLDWLEARPREREAGFESVRLGLGAGGVEAMELLDHFGQTTRLRFTNLVRNPRFDAGTFRFSPPKGADVLGE